jgi:uncharacterized YigZ family protein
MLKTVTSEVTNTHRNRGSKFIGYLFPVKSKNAFEDRLSELKTKYPDATHHCYAWRIDPTNLEEFAQDDGEPGGTAGMPILNQLKSWKVANAGLVVVRYYGGTKLGKTGLIEAYGYTAELCLASAELRSIRIIYQLIIRYPYFEQNTIEQLIHNFDLTEIDANYMEDVTLTLGCPEEHAGVLEDSLEHLSHRGIEAQFQGKSFI